MWGGCSVRSFVGRGKSLKVSEQNLVAGVLHLLLLLGFITSASSNTRGAPVVRQVLRIRLQR